MNIRMILVTILILAASISFSACKITEVDLMPSAIVFTDGINITKEIGSGSYINEVSGEGDGSITYSSSTPETAVVNSGTGEVSLISGGTTTITAVKAATATHSSVTNSYTLIITKLPSTIDFDDSDTVSLALNDGPYTNAVSGEGDGSIFYSSGTPETAAVNSTTGEISLIDVGTSIITAVKSSTGTHETVTATYTLTVTDAIVYAIGDTGPSGVGIVFYVTDGGTHGLEAAPTDQSAAAEWSNIYDALANGSTPLPADIGSGASNTDAMIAQNNAGPSAGKICRDYRGGGRKDWFLPSKDELNQLNLQKNTVGNFATTTYSESYYWSSSESDWMYVWQHNFNYDNAGTSNKVPQHHVRAIRAF